MEFRLTALPSFPATVLSGFGRFPVSAIALAAFATYVNLGIAEVISLSDAELWRAALALGGAAAIAAAAVLFGESHGTSAPMRHVGALLLAILVGVSLWFWRQLAVAPEALFAAALLTGPLAPYLRGSGAGLWQFIGQLVHAGALALIATVLFCAGVSGILASLDYLFGIEVKSSVYGHIWAIGLGFVGPLFALSLVPISFPDRDVANPEEAPVFGVRILSDFIAVPLLATYALVLHAYALKILATGELPKNQIGWMVLTFGLTALSLRVVVDPLHAIVREPTRLFRRYWAPSMIVPLALLVIAVWQRLGEYGMTPQRYGLALFAVFLALVLIAQLVPRLRGDIRVIPGVGALCLLAASFGPWGIVSTSANSQTERLLAHLTSANSVEGGRLVRAPQLAYEPAVAVRSIVAMLDSIGQLHRLEPLFVGRDDPLVADAGDELEARQRVWDALNVAELPPALGREGEFSIYTNEPAVVAIAGYDVVFPGVNLPGSTGRAAGFELSVADAAGGFLLRWRGAQSLIPDVQLRTAIEERLQIKTGTPNAPFLIEVEANGRRIGFLMRNIRGKLTETDVTVDAAYFDLFLRRAEWD